GEIVSHRGEFWSFGEVQMWPPAEPAIPLVLGGTSRPALRRTARYGSGWYSPSNFQLDDVLRVRDQVDRLRTEYGTDHRDFTYHVRVEGEQTPENVARYRAEGLDSLILPLTAEWRRPDVEWTIQAR